MTDNDIAKHIRTEPDGTRVYEYAGNEITEERLTELMERQYARERLLEEWRQSVQLPDHDAWKSDEALRRLADRGVDQPTQEQFLRELERVTPETGEEN
jgi:hypothetical protein